MSPSPTTDRADFPIRLSPWRWLTPGLTLGPMLGAVNGLITGVLAGTLLGNDNEQVSSAGIAFAFTAVGAVIGFCYGAIFGLLARIVVPAEAGSPRAVVLAMIVPAVPGLVAVGEGVVFTLGFLVFPVVLAGLGTRWMAQRELIRASQD